MGQEIISCTEKSVVDNPFNTPLECGLRSLILLFENYPLKSDLQHLIFLDYLLVHSGDAGGPSSIHPATPDRSGEVLVRRELVENGLLLMLSRNLICRYYESDGIFYGASESSAPFLDSLATNYICKLKERAKWVVNRFGHQSSIEIGNFFRANLDRWGGEFEAEIMLEDDE